MSTFSRLVASAPPRLLAWLQTPVADPLGDLVDHGTVRVRPVVERAERRLEMFAAKVKHLADMWTEDAQSGGHMIDWSSVSDEDVRLNILPTILEDYGQTLKANYKVTEADIFRALCGYRDDQRKAELSGVSIWTDAPKDYDHGYARRTGETYQPSFMNRPLYRVIVPSEAQAQYQGRRYGSGMYVVFDTERVAQERALDEKKARVEPYIKVAHDLKKLVDGAAKQLRTHYDVQLAYWKDGVLAPRYDERTGRSYPYPVPESELPPADAVAAARTLVDVRKRFAALPEEVQKEHWRVGVDARDLLKTAGRQVRKRVEGTRTRAKAAAEVAKEQARARALTVARLEASGVPGNPDLVLVRTFLEGASYNRSGSWSGPKHAYGRIRVWPPGEAHIETDAGPVPYPFRPDGSAVGERLDVVAGPPFPVPPAVWAAGVLPPVGLVNLDDGTQVYASNQGVFNEDGTKVRSNTKAYTRGMAALKGEEQEGMSQDQLLDRALSEYLVEYEPAPGWGPTRVTQGIKIQFHPPAALKKGSLKGWQVRSRIMQRDEVGWLTLTRELKKHPSGGYWQHPTGDAFVADRTLNQWLDSLSSIDRRRALTYLMDDPRRTKDDAQQALWKS